MGNDSGVTIKDFDLVPIWNKHQKTIASFSVVLFDAVTVYGFLLRLGAEGYTVVYPRHQEIGDPGKDATRVLSMRRDLFDLVVASAAAEYEKAIGQGSGIDAMIDLLTAPIDIDPPAEGDL